MSPLGGGGFAPGGGIAPPGGGGGGFAPGGGIAPPGGGGGGFAPGGGGLLGSGCCATTAPAVVAIKHAINNFDSFINTLLEKNTQ